MATQNVELLDARADLARFLDQLPAHDVDHEVIELLADMNRASSLAFRWAEYQGVATRSWYALNPKLYAHRVYAIDFDVVAAVAELFLCGELEFSVQTSPLEVLWHQAMPRHTNEWIM